MQDDRVDNSGGTSSKCSRLSSENPRFHNECGRDRARVSYASPATVGALPLVNLGRPLDELDLEFCKEASLKSIK